eukprot:1178272-Prorocentrum_minimum.AAC.1
MAWRHGAHRGAGARGRCGVPRSDDVSHGVGINGRHVPPRQDGEGGGAVAEARWHVAPRSAAGGTAPPCGICCGLLSPPEGVERVGELGALVPHKVWVEGTDYKQSQMDVAVAGVG